MTNIKMVLVLCTELIIITQSAYSPLVNCLYENVVPPTEAILEVNTYTFDGILNAFILTTQSTTLHIYRKEISGCSFTGGASQSVIVDNFAGINFQIIEDTVSVLYPSGGSFSRTIMDRSTLSLISTGAQPNFYLGIYLSSYDYYFFYDSLGNEGMISSYKLGPTTSLYDNFYETFTLQNVRFKMNRLNNILVIQERLTNKIRFKYFDNVTQINQNLSSNYFVNAPNAIEAFCIYDYNIGYFLMTNGQVISYNIETRTIVNASVASGLYGVNEMVYDSFTNSIFAITISTFATLVGHLNLCTGQYLGGQGFFIDMTGGRVGIQRQYYSLWSQSAPSFRIVSYRNADGCLDSQLYSTTSCQCENITVAEENILQFKQFLSIALSNSVVSTFNKIPGGRKVVKFFFFFFSNLDDLWLFQYHNRNYGETMNSLFEGINNLEKQKWEMIQANTTRKWLSKININEQSIVKYVDNRTSYSSPKFIEIEGRGEGFLANSWFYLTVYALLVLLTFFVLRRMFFLLFDWRISIVLRPFSFWSYLILMLLDGNVQYFYFLFLNQAKLGFSFNFHEKMIRLLTHFLFFMFLIVSISSYFIYYQIYKNLAKYFFDQAKTNIKGAIFLCISSTIRNLILGALHNFLRSQMELQLLSLGVVEVSYILILVLFMNIKNTFTDFFGNWISICFSFIRIIMIGCFYLQQTSLQDELLLENIEVSLQFLIKIYVMLYFFGVIIEFVKRSIDVVRIKKSNQNCNESKNLQQIQQKPEQKKQNQKRKSSLQQAQKQPIKGILIKKNLKDGERSQQGFKFEKIK